MHSDVDSICVCILEMGAKKLIEIKGSGEIENR